MKIKVKKNNETLIARDDVISITDKGGAYEIVYEDYMAQAVYKDDGIVLEVY